MADQPVQLALDIPGVEVKHQARTDNLQKVDVSHRELVAHVVILVTAIHMAQTFTYSIPPALTDTLEPGMAVSVPFGRRVVTGFVWSRGVETVSVSLKPIRAQLSTRVLINGQMRRDVEEIARLYGGTRAEILSLAFPTHNARVEQERDWDFFAAKARGEQRFTRSVDEDLLEEMTTRELSDYRGSLAVHMLIGAGEDGEVEAGAEREASVDEGRVAEERTVSAAEEGRTEASTGEASAAEGPAAERNTGEKSAAGEGAELASQRLVIWDVVPGFSRWVSDIAWMIVQAKQAGRPVVCVLPSSSHIARLSAALHRYGLVSLESIAAREDALKREISHTKKQAHAQGVLSRKLARTLKKLTKEGQTSDELHDMAQQAQAASEAYERLSGHVHNLEDAQASLERELTDGAGPLADYCTLDSSTSPLTRSRSLTALSSGAVTCVLGTRASMYAPVGKNALFICMSENAYVYSDGEQPYASVSGVLRLRARLHDGLYVAVSLSRSAQAQFDVETGAALSVQGTQEARHAIHVSWLNREFLQSHDEPRLSARIPRYAVGVMTQALNEGPVLVLADHAGFALVLTCDSCHHAARCSRCTGPLREIDSAGHIQCAWCGASATQWVCPNCGNTSLRKLKVGAQGTAREVSMLMKSQQVIVSQPASPQFPRGPIAQIDASPRVVVATANAIPKVNGVGYSAVIILDAWASQYDQRLDARTDTLNLWMGEASQVKLGGQVLLIGECDPFIADALCNWDAQSLARAELEERRQTGLPPIVAAASVWGDYPAVMQAVESVDVDSFPPLVASLYGKDGLLHEVEVPRVMGPVSVRLRETERKAPPLAGASERVKVIVRVPLSSRQELATRLHQAASLVSIQRQGELRFWMDPKNLAIH